MPNPLRCAATIAALLLPPTALAAEPVRHIGIYVQPYYEAAASLDASPRIAVGASYSDLLASTLHEDIVAVRDTIAADPKMVTPMTLMVLAIRLYEIDLRDDAVFWFYAAKDRYITLSDVVDIQAGNLAQVEDAVRNFVTLAGPIINGYAFCDPANQDTLRARALAWVEENPYGAIFLEQLPARSDDRNALLQQSLAALKTDAEKERVYFKDPKNLAEFNTQRKQNEMDDKFCWQ